MSQEQEELYFILCSKVNPGEVKGLSPTFNTGIYVDPV